MNPFGVCIFIVYDLNVVIVTSFILASLNVNFVRKFVISNVVDVVHMSMNFGAKIWCHVFGKFGQIQRVDFRVHVCLVKSVLK